MEIILLDNVAKCGSKGSVVNVAPGYAQFLISSKKAQVATAKTKASVEKQIQLQKKATVAFFCN